MVCCVDRHGGLSGWFGWRSGVGDKAFIVVERNGSVVNTVIRLIM